MSGLEQRVEFLEEANDVLRMQNRVLAVAFKGMLRALPADIQQDVVESVQLAFEDTLAELSYEDSQHIDIFHDVTYSFFREKEF